MLRFEGSLTHLGKLAEKEVEVMMLKCSDMRSLEASKG